MPEDVVFKSAGLRIVPMTRQHVERILVTPDTIVEAHLLGYDSSQDFLESVLENERSYTILSSDGAVIGFTGIVLNEDGAQMFAILGREAKKHRVAVVRGARALVEHFHVEYDKLYMVVNRQFAIMVQFATMLGFRYIGHDGDGFISFVRCANNVVKLSEAHRPTKH